MSYETEDKYRVRELSTGKPGIFAPNDICAMAVVDGYIGSKEKVQELLRKANCHDDLLEALEFFVTRQAGDLPTYMNPALERARAAIAKATVVA